MDYYNYLVHAFDSYAAPKRNKTYERYIFNQCHPPRSRGDIRSLFNRAKTLVTMCGFGDKEKSLLRDRIVVGIRDHKIQEVVLCVEDLNLEQVAHDCRVAERSKLYSETFKAGDKVKSDLHNMDAIQYGNKQPQQWYTTCDKYFNKVMIVGLYTGIALVTIHLISCVLLLYGAIMQIRQFLLPWISIVLISLVFSLTGLLVSMLLRKGTISILLVTALGMQIRLFSWLVVYSYYRHLYEAQSTTCAMMIQQDTKTIGNGYMNFPHYYKPAEV